MAAQPGGRVPAAGLSSRHDQIQSGALSGELCVKALAVYGVCTVLLKMIHHQEQLRWSGKLGSVKCWYLVLMI